MNPVFRPIVALQIALNNKTAPDWLTAQLDWQTAILVESAEAIDSTDWKWWKAGQTDLDNLRVESIDILHFAISQLMTSTKAEQPVDIPLENVVSVLEGAYLSRIEGLGYVDYFKAIARHALALENGKLLQNLFGVLGQLGLDEQGIYTVYLTKNLLNIYRQSRGYKDPGGGYIKDFNGQEDNVVFANIIASLPKHSNLDVLQNQAFDEMDRFVACFKEVG